MTTVESYINSVDKDKQEAFIKLRTTIVENIPKGFNEEINYGMIGYVVPHSLYPKGYHCDKTKPLPFINIAAQKNFIALYHMGIYADSKLMEWFVKEYAKASKTKLDMGKSCIRFKNVTAIPFELIATLVAKISVKEWVERYESKFVK